jgi:hypothetical protein
MPIWALMNAGALVAEGVIGPSEGLGLGIDNLLTFAKTWMCLVMTWL